MREERTAKVPARLGYKEQRELAELPQRIEALGREIVALEHQLADGGLYQRDRAAFEAATERHEEARRALDAAETRWLELEEKRVALAAAAEAG
jgi:ATP-binding cassette subfamily F protein uup